LVVVVVVQGAGVGTGGGDYWVGLDGGAVGDAVAPEEGVDLALVGEALDVVQDGFVGGALKGEG
jgi:hypothetical protein